MNITTNENAIYRTIKLLLFRVCVVSYCRRILRKLSHRTMIKLNDQIKLLSVKIASLTSYYIGYGNQIYNA